MTNSKNSDDTETREGEDRDSIPSNKTMVDNGEKRIIEIDPTTQSTKDLYKLLIGAVVPRPIAFVSTVSESGVTNLAPYSFFNGISSNPPCVMISCAALPDKKKKHTLKNIEDTGEFVVNSANEWLLEPLVHCAAEFPDGVSEFKEVGFTESPCKKVKAPRVGESALSLECKLHTVLPIGDGGPGSATVIIGEIVYAHVDEKCYENGRISFDSYKAVGRLGGSKYGKVGEIVDIPVPSLKS